MPPRINSKAASGGAGAQRKTNAVGGGRGRPALRRKDSKTQDNMGDMGMEDEEIDQ